MNPISVKDKLPKDRQRVLWWHSLREQWYIGYFYCEEGQYSPGYFSGAVVGYISDGVATHWTPTPPPVHTTAAAPDEACEKDLQKEL